jgi:hypothetical protein
MMDASSIEGDDLVKMQNKNMILPQLNYGKENVNTIELLGVENINDKDYYKIKVLPAYGEDYSVEFYSVETGLLMIEEIFTKDPEGNPSTIRYEHSNYEIVDDKMLLAKTSQLNSSGQILALKLVEVSIEKKAKNKAFEGDFTEVEKSLAE